MRSPMGEGALRGFSLSVIVVARRGLFVKGIALDVGLTAVFGGGLGGDTGRAAVSNWGYNQCLMI